MIQANHGSGGRNGRKSAPPVGGAGLPLRRRALHGLQVALQRTGMAHAYVRARRPRGAVILMYHSVAESDDAHWLDPRNHIASRVFARHVAFLAQHRRVISLSALLDVLDRGDDPEAGTVVLTFDDGYRDNLAVAAPLLQAAGLPATLFLATGYVERGENQWIDQLYGAFVNRTRHDLTLPDGQQTDVRAPDAARSAYRQLAGALLEASPDRRESMLAEVRAGLRPETIAPRLTLTWDEAQRAAATFEIGLHTREHVDLTGLDDQAVERELVGCQSDAAAALGKTPRLFSFPYSRSSAASRARVARAGFRAAAAREAAEIVRSGCDCYDLPRIVAPASLPRLAFVTSGAYPGLSRALVGRA